jgi:Domain of unknown function (DUF4276)
VSVEHIEILVEELSMEAALRTIMPKIVGQLSHEIYPYQCKQDLLSKLPDRLAGYAYWLPDNWRIIVIVDRDDDNCNALKASMEAISAKVGLSTRASAASGSYSVINRLAIEELEAWYFGDWPAVKSAYPRVPTTVPQRAGYRDPDMIAGGTWEAFERILRRAGYFGTGLRKIEAARAISAYMDPSQNSSRSFQSLRDALIDMR